jgi:hypothetical protein
MEDNLKIFENGRRLQFFYGTAPGNYREIMIIFRADGGHADYWGCSVAGGNRGTWKAK